MYGDLMLDDIVIADEVNTMPAKETNLDSLFNNLTQDIENVNKIISDVSKKRKHNEEETVKIEEERQKLEEERLAFENYCKTKEEEFLKKQSETDEYIVLQQEKLRKAEEDFRNSMSTSLSQLESEKKSLEQGREELKKEQEQFIKFKETSEKRLDKDSKMLEEKCMKFKEIINQFNDNFEIKFDEE